MIILLKLETISAFRELKEVYRFKKKEILAYCLLIFSFYTIIQILKSFFNLNDFLLPNFFLFFCIILGSSLNKDILNDYLFSKRELFNKTLPINQKKLYLIKSIKYDLMTALEYSLLLSIIWIPIILSYPHILILKYYFSGILISLSLRKLMNIFQRKTINSFNISWKTIFLKSISNTVFTTTFLFFIIYFETLILNINTVFKSQFNFISQIIDTAFFGIRHFNIYLLLIFILLFFLRILLIDYEASKPLNISEKFNHNHFSLEKYIKNIFIIKEIRRMNDIGLLLKISIDALSFILIIISYNILNMYLQINLEVDLLFIIIFMIIQIVKYSEDFSLLSIGFDRNTIQMYLMASFDIRILVLMKTSILFFSLIIKNSFFLLLLKLSDIIPSGSFFSLYINLTCFILMYSLYTSYYINYKPNFDSHIQIIHRYSLLKITIITSIIQYLLLSVYIFFDIISQQLLRDIFINTSLIMISLIFVNKIKNGANLFYGTYELYL
ncbi:MAG: hypothetical protein ABS890_04740 [Carnobacterium inhibens]